MSGRIKNWLSWLNSSWYGSLIVYASIFIVVYGSLWGLYFEPWEVATEIRIGPNTLDRRHLHVMLAVFAACHLTILLDLYRRRKYPKHPFLKDVSDGLVFPSKGGFPGHNTIEFLKEPLTISLKCQTLRYIENSDFLKWQQCTILLGVNVPKKGEGLRDTLGYRYLLSHHTGRLPGSDRTRNQFHLRYSKDNKWELIFRNNKNEGEDANLIIDDNLAAGWHQFVIAWNENQLLFFVDGGTEGPRRSTRFQLYRPERTSNRIAVGVWFELELPPYKKTYYKETFCETEICHLWIDRRFLDLSHEKVKEHLELLNQPVVISSDNNTEVVFSGNTDKEDLIINSAKYGPKHKSDEIFERTSIDVTDALRSEISEGKLDILVSNNLGGDPFPGEVKRLVIVYSHAGKTHTKTISEGDMLTLP